MFKLIGHYLRLFRICFAVQLANLAHYLIRNENKPVAPPVNNEDSPVPFTDVNSYVDKLKTPQGADSGAIAVCAQMYDFSRIKKTPIKLSFILSITHDANNVVSQNSGAAIAGFSNDRWYKLMDLELSSKSIPLIISEALDGLAQHGWGCMNDSLEQISSYTNTCLSNNRAYVENYCKRTGEEATIKLNVSVIIDVNPATETYKPMQPQINTKISVTTGKEEPVQSGHSIYFQKRKGVIEKSQA